jgi:hypothetical protein
MNEPEEEHKFKKRNYPYFMLENHLERLREEWLDDLALGVYWGPVGKLHKYGRTLNSERFERWE